MGYRKIKLTQLKLSKGEGWPEFSLCYISVLLGVFVS